MTWQQETTDARDIIFDTFAIAVSHVESGSDFRGVYNQVYGEDEGVETRQIGFSCITSEIPVTLRIGHKLTDGTYTDRIIAIQDDRKGKTTMVLERTQ